MCNSMYYALYEWSKFDFIVVLNITSPSLNVWYVKIEKLTN